jgi:membrane associated rhomboid family serine protease
MALYRTRSPIGFGSRLTPLGKKLLLVYGTIYAIELVLHHWIRIPIVAELQLYPLGSPNFRIWQLVTHPFLQNPFSPLSFLLSCLVFYFFASAIEGYYGSRRFLHLFYLSALGAMVLGLAFGGVSGFDGPFLGMSPSILSLVVVFGLVRPEATILLMFILPIRAKYLSYGTALITVLTFLAKANPHGAYHLGGILVGYLYVRGFLASLDPEALYTKYLNWQLKRKKSRFRIIEGAKSEDDEEHPTYH